ncbi:MAG: hypothetical protein AB8G86_15915 [Saprospiraceae bacterium]
MKIEALHEFHEMEFSKDWAKRLTPTPDRLALFETILQRIREIGGENCQIKFRWFSISSLFKII